MSLAMLLARRSLFQRPARTAFSILGIAVGIATVVGIFALDHNTLIVRAHSDDPDWRAEIEVSPSAAVASPREELAQLRGISSVTAAFQSQAQLWTNASAGGPGERVALVAIEAERAAELGRYFLVRGGDLAAPAGPPARPGALPRVLIGERLAEGLALDVGSTVVLSAPRRAPARECVGGEWVTVANEAERPPEQVAFEVAGVLGREGLGRKARGQVVVVDYGAGRRLFEGVHVETRYWVRKDPAINLETLKASLGEAWSYELKKSVIIGQAADERAFRNGVRFAGLLALVLGLYVIFHTLSVSLVERVREIGTLHALGASRAQIGRVFFTEAVLIAGAGGALGLLGGLALAAALLCAGITTVGLGVPMSRVRVLRLFEVPWETVAPVVAAGVAIALAGSVYPLLRARSVDAVKALRGEDTLHSRGLAKSFQLFAALLLALVLPAVYFGVVPVIGEQQSELVGVLMLGLGIVALFVAVPLVAPVVIAFACRAVAEPFARRWPLAGRLAARAIEQGPTRVAGAVAGLALVTAGFVGLRGMTRSLEAEIDVWSREAFRDKVYVRNVEPKSLDEVIERLHEHPEVLGVEPNEARTYSPFLLIGLREDELARYGPCRDSPRLIDAMREQRGVILSRRLAVDHGYEVGDAIHVQAPTGKVESFPVVAVSDAYGYFPHPDERLYGVVSDRYMRQLFCVDTDSVSSLSVRFREGTDAEDAAAIVRAALEIEDGGAGTIETGDYLYGWHSTDIARDFVLFDIVVALTVALAGLGILNGQLLAALERAKELGVLKALGTSRRQIAGTVVLESAVIGLIGGGLGAALGAALAPVIVSALHVISGLALPHVGPGAFLAAGWIGAVAVALASGVYPIWCMNRADAVAAVRTGG
jgi:putative ABC transport system permease protein